MKPLRPGRLFSCAIGAGAELFGPDIEGISTMRLTAFGFAVFVFSAVLLGAPAAFAAPEKCVIDPAHTQVEFSIDRFGFNRVVGRFDAVAGEVTLDQTAPGASGVVATIQTASISTGNAERDAHLKGPNWLKTDQFPTMTFRSTGVTTDGANRAHVTGALTLLGVSAPVVLDVMLNKIGDDPATRRPAAGFSASTVISRRTHGLTTASALIGDAVIVKIEALCFR